MGKKRLNLNKEKIIFYMILLLGFLAIYVYNLLTPVMSDDLLFDKSLYTSVGDIFIQEYKQYMTWNGRSVLQILLKIFSLLPLKIFWMCNSLCFMVLNLLIYFNVKSQKKYDYFLLILIQLCLWNFSVDFSQTVLWLSGACNYLWGMVIILAFISLYSLLMKREEFGKKKIAVVLIILPSFLAGWGNENTSGGAILIILGLTVWYYVQKKKIEWFMISGIISTGVGFLFLLLAPGNKVRGAIVKAEETYTGVEAYISRGLKVLKSIDEHLLLYLIVICILGTYFYYKKYSWKQFVEVFIFALAGLATAAVLIFTPEPMPRAYYGANIYMLIAALKMVQMIPRQEVLLYAGKIGGILAGGLFFFFVYIEEGANLVRIQREVRGREEYILQEVEKGNYNLVLPKLREQFESKYSMAHLSDISGDKENWNNELYKEIYGLTEIEVLPWDEWEEKIGQKE